MKSNKIRNKRKEQSDRSLVNIKRKILIVEDNDANRVMLASMLDEDYDLFYAESSQIGLELLADYYQELSLVLLNVYMPAGTGFEFLQKAGADPRLSSVPVMVTTDDIKPEDEIRCLDLGAVDFIAKPYTRELVLARVRRVIQLQDSVATLSAVELDELTGLYTMPAFSHHAAEELQRISAGVYHLLAVDLNEFKMINTIFGEKKGDEVLSYIGDVLVDFFPEGMIGRDGDRFFVLFECEPSFCEDDIDLVWERITLNDIVPNLKVKCAIYKDVDHECPVAELCERVVMVADSIKKISGKNWAEYDVNIQNKLQENERMELRFEDALKNEEFIVWFQPVVEPGTEKIVAAEALIRWVTNDGKMISPGAFIPLFEGNGMISQLDRYVFQKVCQFQQSRILEGKTVVPVSVNLSRNSIYRSESLDHYMEIITAADIPKHLVPIEIKESVVMENAEIKALTMMFKQLGFSLNLDNFSTGYSSFAALATMPFDMIKLDKSLIDHIGSNKGNTMIRHLISIAQEIGMKVAAEGVEGQEQIEFLKDAGCDGIQGYYFATPKDQRMFEMILDTYEE